MACCRGKQRKEDARKALMLFLTTTARAIGGAKCCSGNGKFCALEGCRQPVRREWFRHSGVSLGYHACSSGHTMQLG